jgi:hypothetical protein
MVVALETPRERLTVGSMEGLGCVERTDGDVVPARSENSAVPVLGFTCGSSSNRLTRARALVTPSQSCRPGRTRAGRFGFEVPIIIAARLCRNFKSKNRTRIIDC